MKWLSRKLIVSILLLILATVLAFYKLITGLQWCIYSGLIGIAYIYINGKIQMDKIKIDTPQVKINADENKQ